MEIYGDIDGDSIPGELRRVFIEKMRQRIIAQRQQTN